MLCLIPEPCVNLEALDFDLVLRRDGNGGVKGQVGYFGPFDPTGTDSIEFAPYKGSDNVTVAGRKLRSRTKLDL